jgi:hypothetical protein
MPTVNLSALAGAGQQFFDNNGTPLSGGKLYSYAAGTTTPQTTYTSASGATAHTNPIVLDSAGRVATGEIWLTAGQNYKFVLKTSVEVTLATWDNITGINGTGITSNAVNVEYDPPFTGAVTSGYTVQDKLAQTVSVKDFGAVGNGVADDTAEIQAALNASRSIDIPNGNYLLSSAVTTDAPVVINGTGSGGKILGAGIAINSAQTRYGYLLNLHLDGVGTGNGLLVDETHRVKFDGIYIRDFVNGAEFNFAYLNTLINCEFSFNSTGALFKNFTNGTTAYSCTFANNTNHGATVQSSQKFVFHGCDFENNTNYGLVVDSSDNGTLQNLNGTVDSCYFENNASDVFVGNGANAVKTTNWVFKDNCHLGSKAYGYLVDHAFGTKIIRPDFTGATFSAAAISLTASSQNTTIIPFVSSQVQAAVGATVSIETIQTGSVDVVLDGSGFGDVTINFLIPYYVTPPVRLALYSNSNPSGSLGTASIKNGIGVTGIYVQVHGGPGSTTVKLQWQAGA